jgi:GAF domain-containing protein
VTPDELRRNQAAVLFREGLADKAFAEVESRTLQTGVPLGAADFFPIVMRSPGVGRDLLLIGLRVDIGTSAIVHPSIVGWVHHDARRQLVPAAAYNEQDLEQVVLLAEAAAGLLTQSELEKGVP